MTNFLKLSQALEICTDITQELVVGPIYYKNN